MSTAAPGASPLQRVRIERRGGIAGLRIDAEHDASALTPAQQRALATLVRASAAASGAPAVSPGADRLRYRLRLTHADGTQHLIDVAEDDMPDALAALARPSLP